MSKINVLALDVASHCGFCTKTASGTWDLTPKRDESSGMRLIRFRAKLKEICAAEDINLITFERTAGFHKNALIVQAELHGILKVFCEDNAIEYRAYSATEIKKFSTGKGNAKKTDMVFAAQNRWGMKGDNDNEADAIAIYHLTIQDLNL